MPGGRPRKPSRVLQLQGTFRKDRHGGTEPAPTNPVAAKPDWLVRKRRASLVWDELAPERIAMGVLTSADAEEFAHLCCFIAEFRRKPADFPSARLAHLRALMSFFGFNPSARAKIGVTQKPKENPFQKLG